MKLSTETGLRASIIAGCKPAKCRGGGERRGKRVKAGCKFTDSSDTKTKKSMRQTYGLCINSDELTII